MSSSSCLRFRSSRRWLDRRSVEPDPARRSFPRWTLAAFSAETRAFSVASLRVLAARASWSTTVFTRSGLLPVRGHGRFLDRPDRTLGGGGRKPGGIAGIDFGPAPGRAVAVAVDGFLELQRDAAVADIVRLRELRARIMIEDRVGVGHGWGFAAHL